jgi:UDP-2-acetamido-3-amino-2,3-dideoxy-glucuronate N-acetyltransferase
MTVRVGLAGCGYWGINLARNFHRIGALTAIADASEATRTKAAGEFNVTPMTWEAMVADPAIDAIAIAAPAELHAKLAIEALQAGKHVYVEKPLALSEADGVAVTEAAEKAGKTLMIGHLLQYHPAFVALRELVRSGGLGRLRYVYSHRLSLGKLRTEENALWSFAPHDISMVLALFGQEPETVKGYGESYVTPGVDDWNRVEMQFPGGGSAHIFASWLHPFKEHRLTVIGDKAMAVFEDSAGGEQKLRLYRHEMQTGPGAPVFKKADAEAIPYGSEEPLLAECQHFVDCISANKPPLTGAKEALNVLRVLVKASQPGG